MLPTEKKSKKVGLAGRPVLIYGQAKIGKSTFCSQLPDAVFLATEKGLEDLEVFETPVRDWNDMLKACAELAAGNHTFRNIVIDTVDNAYLYCSEYVCGQQGWTHESDGDMGKGWAMVRAEFTRVITKLSMLPYGLWLVAHASDKRLKDRTGDYLKSVPSLPGKAGEMIVALSDVILFADHDEERVDGKVVESRILRTRGSKYWEAGTRLGLALPETIPLSHKAFEAAFLKASTPAAPSLKEVAASTAAALPPGTTVEARSFVSDEKASVKTCKHCGKVIPIDCEFCGIDCAKARERGDPKPAGSIYNEYGRLTDPNRGPITQGERGPSASAPAPAPAPEPAKTEKPKRAARAAR